MNFSDYDSPKSIQMVPVEEKLIFNKKYDALHTVNFGRTLAPVEAKIKILESSQ
jgi:hypothetical protein